MRQQRSQMIDPRPENGNGDHSSKMPGQVNLPPNVTPVPQESQEAVAGLPPLDGHDGGTVNAIVDGQTNALVASVLGILRFPTQSENTGRTPSALETAILGAAALPPVPLGVPTSLPAPMTLVFFLPLFYNPENGTRRPIELEKWKATLEDLRLVFPGFTHWRVDGYWGAGDMHDVSIRFEIDGMMDAARVELLKRWKGILGSRFEQDMISFKLYPVWCI
jgi:hypothetical protein